MGIAISAVVLLFTLLAILLLIYAAIVRYRGRHTREKYALPALGAITSIAIAAITSVTSFPPWPSSLCEYSSERFVELKNGNVVTERFTQSFVRRNT